MVWIGDPSFRKSHGGILIVLLQLVWIYEFQGKQFCSYFLDEE
jgi:hypothetical protein